MKSHLSVLLVLALVTGLAGCSSRDSTDPAATDYQSPLLPYWSAIESRDSKTFSAEDEAESVESPGTYGQIVAECMAEEGFEYTDTGAYEVENAPQDETPTGSLERAEQDGYGIVPKYSEVDQTVPDSSVPEDPNEKYLATLSESEMKAYYLALDGTYWEEVSSGDDFVWDWEKSGCNGKAAHLIENPFIVGEEPSEEVTPFDELIAMMDEVGLQVEDTPQWREVLEQWSSCMAKQSYHYASPSAAQSEFEEKLSELANPGTPLGSQQQFDDLYQLERDVAAADAQCQIATDFEGNQNKIIYELETEFVKENRNRLEEMRNWFEGNR